MIRPENDETVENIWNQMTEQEKYDFSRGCMRESLSSEGVATLHHRVQIGERYFRVRLHFQEVK